MFLLGWRPSRLFSNCINLLALCVVHLRHCAYMLLVLLACDMLWNMSTLTGALEAGSRSSHIQYVSEVRLLLF